MKRDRMIDIISEAIHKTPSTHPLRVAVDGVDASGKTNLANELADRLSLTQRQIIRASVDDFHNPEHIRRARGSYSPEGFYHDSYNYPALLKFLLMPLGPQGDRRYRQAAFDYRLNTPVESPVRTAGPDAILILDGIFLLRSWLLPYWDLTLYLEAAFTITMNRGIARDAELYGSHEIAARRYRERYIPGQCLYLREENPLDKADILIDNNQIEAPEILRIPDDSLSENRDVLK